jgi:hypothetical protein
VAAANAGLWVGVLFAMWSSLSQCTLLQLMFQSMYCKSTLQQSMR